MVSMECAVHLLTVDSCSFQFFFGCCCNFIPICTPSKTLVLIISCSMLNAHSLPLITIPCEFHVHSIKHIYAVSFKNACTRKWMFPLKKFGSKCRSILFSRWEWDEINIITSKNENIPLGDGVQLSKCSKCKRIGTSQF